ncbi:MAG: hypothetical protein U9Q81_23215 [Pseudomonadota bacterium]|nr:hypothetical protein [Pseudomonadota bacterium]
MKRSPAGLWVVLLLLLHVPGAHAQDAASSPNGPQTVTADARDATDPVSGSSVTEGRLESKIKEVEATAELDEATRSKLTEYYRKALSSLEAAKSYDAKIAAFAQAIETAPEQTKELRRRLEAAPPDGEQEPLPDGLSIKEIEQRLAKEQADVAAVEAKVSEMEKELETWSRRPTEMRKRITEAKGELEEIAEALARQVPEGESPSLTEARRWVSETRQREVRSEILMLDRELLSHAAREDLLKAERDKSAQDLKMLSARKRFLEDQLNERRRAQAEQARAEAETAKREAVGKHALVEELAHLYF